MVFVFVYKSQCLEMDHFRMLTIRKRFKFFSQQHRIIGESSLISQSYPRRTNTEKCF